MAEIDKIDRKSAIQLAKNMRRRVRNLTLDKQAAGARLSRTLTGAAAAAVGGYMMGGLEHDYRSDQARIDAGEAEDPRMIGGVLPKDLALGLTLAGLSMAGIGGKKMAGYLEAGGNGLIDGWTYQQMFTRGLEAAKEGGA